jgi:hypothetical protein
VFLAGNLAACVVIIAAVLTPMQGVFAERDAYIAGELTRLARFSAVAGQAANAQAILSDTTAQMRGGEFLAGSNENVISADLQTRLKAMTEAAGAHARAVQALPAKVSDEIRFSGSRIEIFGPLQSIRHAVHAIESAKPYLFIAGATIKGAPAMSGQGPAGEPTIQAQLDVYGAIQLDGQQP